MANVPKTPPAHLDAFDLRDRWKAELGRDGFYSVVDQDGVIVALHCVMEEARLIAAVPALFKSVRSAVATYQDRLSLLEEEREWRPDDEYEDMKGHYSILLREATAALSLATADPLSVVVHHAGKVRTLRIDTNLYQSGGLAVELFEGPEPYTMLSMMVSGVELQTGEFVAKTYSENEGLLEALVEADAVRVVRGVTHALGVLPVCRLVG
jgi:hypothetical protein